LARLHSNLQTIRSAILRYGGLSVACVGVALGLALACKRHGFRDFAAPLFDLGIVLATWATWFGEVGPVKAAVVVSAASLGCFYSLPQYSFQIPAADIPYFIIFTIWTDIISGFLNVRCRIESDPRYARDLFRTEIERIQHREREIIRLGQELSGVLAPGAALYFPLPKADVAQARTASTS
jgi:hypothetical protein